MDKRMRIRYLTLILVSLAFIFMFTSAVFAHGPATVYKVTLTKFELSSDGGANYITVFEGTSAVLDIASAADTSTSVGNFMSGLSVPDGTYNHYRVTPSATFTISGHDGTSYTTAHTEGAGGSTPTTDSTLEAECTVTIPGGVAAEHDALPTPITVKDGVSDHRVRVKFDTSLAIEENGTDHLLYPAQPVVTISVL